ncbi:MAG TPA: hypothetical protein VMU59_06805 [Caulobacteraceae bacterium]|nr:hypothetical protein [Caulobacteraceae bacterium]
MTSSISSLTGAALINYYQGQAALTLFGASTSSAASTSAAALSAYYLNKEGITSSGSSSAAAANAPTAPWNTSTGTPSVSTAVQNAMNGASFVSPSASSLSAPGGSNATDYENLFAVYQGLNTLNDLAQTAAANANSASPTYSTSQLQSVFASGLSQVESFLNTTPFTGFNVTAGQVSQSQSSTVSLPTGVGHNYSTGVIYTGDASSPAPALEGDVQFTISVASTYAPTGTAPTNVNIDLSGMGSTPRTMTNVVGYINRQLAAAGVSSTFAVANLGNATVNSYVDGKATTTTGSPQWGLTINGAAGEQISFSAPSTAAAVYVGETTGGIKSTSATGTSTTSATAQTLIGLQTSNSAVGTPPSTSSVSVNNSSLPNGGIFSSGLPSGVNSVQSEAMGSDGSIYMVADVSGSVNGAPVPGDQGVALMKYDAAGKLVYSKVLSAGSDSSGYSLAVNTDGTVAVVGSNTVAASTSVNGVTTAASTAGFVQVYSPTGVPTWSAKIPASGGTATATGVTFGSDGSVYVSGTTTGSVGGQATQGSSDEFIQGYSPTGASTFTTQYGAVDGTNTSSGIVYDTANNTLYTAGSENSQAVVRSFALNGANSPTAGATRNLGAATSVVGIGLSGGQIVVGGNTIGPTIHAGTVAQAYQGVQDAFVASISTSLTPSSSDSVTYLGGAGETETARAMSTAGGQAYLTGTILNDPNGLAASNATEGFVGGVNVSGGGQSYANTFTAANGQSTPTAIAASATGTSVLNQLGLPDGQINAGGSTLITANTPIKAGDSFYIRTAAGGPQTTITVSAKDTLASLATKINTALGAAGAAQVVSIGSSSTISITPNTGQYIELDATPANAGLASVTNNSTNVLASLGLNAGVIRTVQTVNGLTNPTQLREYGLNLGSLNISSATSAKAASVALQTAIAHIQQAYKDLVSPPTLASEAAAKASSGTAPAYLTAEIANYQAGLNRLLAGSSSSTSTLG